MTKQQVLKRNNVNMFGRGKQPMIFAHGLGLDQTSWSHIQPTFTENYKVVLFDHVGCGQSDESAYDFDKYASLSGYASDLADICNVLELDNAIFVGHSVSAMIGVIASLHRSASFSKMIFIAPSPHYRNDPETDDGSFPKEKLDNIMKSIDDNYAQWVRINIPAILNNPDKPEIASSLIRSFLRVDQKIAKQFALATFFSDYRKELLNFDVPSLILQCRNDMMSPLQVGDYLHAHFKNNTLKLLDAEGHFPHLTDPAEVVQSIVEFLEG